MKKIGTLGEINEARHTSFWDNFGGIKFVIVLVLIAAIGGIAISAMNHNSVASTSANPNSFSGDEVNTYLKSPTSTDSSLKVSVSIPGENSIPMKTFSVKSATTHTDKDISRIFSHYRFTLVSASLPDAHTFKIAFRNDYVMPESMSKITISFNMIDFNEDIVFNGDYKIYATFRETFNPGETKIFQGNIEYKIPTYLNVPDIKNIEISHIEIEG